MSTLCSILRIVRLVFQYAIPLSNSLSAYTNSGKSSISTVKKSNHYFICLLKFWIFDLILGITLMFLTAISHSFWIEAGAIVMLIMAQRNRYDGVEHLYLLVVVNSMKLYEAYLNNYVESALKLLKQGVEHLTTKILPRILSELIGRFMSNATSRTESDMNKFNQERKEIDEVSPSDSTDLKLE